MKQAEFDFLKNTLEEKECLLRQNAALRTKVERQQAELDQAMDVLTDLLTSNDYTYYAGLVRSDVEEGKERSDDYYFSSNFMPAPMRREFLRREREKYALNSDKPMGVKDVLEC